MMMLSGTDVSPQITQIKKINYPVMPDLQSGVTRDLKINLLTVEAYRIRPECAR